MASYRLISSDNHVYEPVDLWTSRVEPKFRDRAPHSVRLEEEGDWWFCDGHKIVGAFAGAQAGRRFEAPEKLSRKDLLEALRKPLSGSVIAKFTLGGRSEFAEHQVDITDLDHGSGRFGFALIVFAVPSGTAVPRIRALNYPAFAYWCEALAAGGTEFHFDSPARTVFRQPGFEHMIVILGIAKDRL